MNPDGLSEDEMREELKKRTGSFLVFETTHLTMKAEALFNDNNIPNRLFPKPRKIISECGLIVKVLHLEKAKEICNNKDLQIKEVIRL